MHSLHPHRERKPCQAFFSIPSHVRQPPVPKRLKLDSASCPGAPASVIILLVYLPPEEAHPPDLSLRGVLHHIAPDGITSNLAELSAGPLGRRPLIRLTQALSLPPFPSFPSLPSLTKTSLSLLRSSVYHGILQAPDARSPTQPKYLRHRHTSPSCPRTLLQVVFNWRSTQAIVGQVESHPHHEIIQKGEEINETDYVHAWMPGAGPTSQCLRHETHPPMPHTLRSYRDGGGQ